MNFRPKHSMARRHRERSMFEQVVQATAGGIVILVVGYVLAYLWLAAGVALEPQHEVAITLAAPVR